MIRVKMNQVMNLKKENQKRKAQRHLKWFGVTLSPTSTVMKFPPTKRKDYTLNL